MMNKIKITTLSPLCIGSGGVMNSITDYIIEGKKFHYVDKQFVANKLAEDDALMDRYIQGVANGMDNNTTIFNLKDFLKNSLRLHPKEYIRDTVDILKVEGKKEVNNIIKDAKHRPYIPGSTLKGAIKTAFLYDWLLKEHNNFNVFDNQLDEQLKKYNISIHDTNSIDTSHCNILETKRLNLISGNYTISQTWEAVVENSSFNTEIWNLKYNDRENEKSYNWEEFCRIINQFTKDQNIRERDILENLGEELDDGLNNSLLDFYADMNDTIVDNPKTAFLRIGSGKGYYHNSVGLALYKKDKNRFLEFLKKNKVVKRNHSDVEKFPITRPVEIANTKPLGLIKIELK
ncbi:MAG: type III-A CRISPR-associated RAMP protein Csm5 [Flavobacteriaceae bacterium]|nr:type III-A CRISPR-associated RAMP protein Csm5 [Flavobacteriaceae bacterium]